MATTTNAVFGLFDFGEAIPGQLQNGSDPITSSGGGDDNQPQAAMDLVSLSLGLEGLGSDNASTLPTAAATNGIAASPSFDALVAATAVSGTTTNETAPVLTSPVAAVVAAPAAQGSVNLDSAAAAAPGGSLCAEFSRDDAAFATTLADGYQVAATPLADLANTFRLSSNPFASKTIYLDFNGHTSTGTCWNDSTNPSFYSPAFDLDGNPSLFGDAELIRIQQIWQHIAADYAPFDVNVTTLEPTLDALTQTANSADQTWGMRAVFTSSGPYSSTAGGVAVMDTFSASVDNPCFIYNKSLLGAAEAGSHEVGHTLGLTHDGTTSGVEYYSGHGSGETGWAPIMGVGYYQNTTQWDDGTYTGSNNGAGGNGGLGGSDIDVITRYSNGITLRNDSVGNSMAAATGLAISSGAVNQFGSIETRADQDWFSFQVQTSCDLSLSFNPYIYRAFIDSDGAWGGSSNVVISQASDANTATSWAENASNLDLLVEVYNGAGTLVASSNPDGLAASLNLTGLAAGSYYLRLDGVGFGSPTSSTPTGYSDYASLGDYRITGSISGAADNAGQSTMPTAPVVLPSLTINDLSKLEGTSSSNTTYSITVQLNMAASSDVLVNYSTMDGSASSTDYTAGSGQLRIAAGQTTGTINLSVLADSVGEGNEVFYVNLSNASGATITDSQALVGINNDDSTTTTTTTTTKKGRTAKSLKERTRAGSINDLGLWSIADQADLLTSYSSGGKGTRRNSATSGNRAVASGADLQASPVAERTPGWVSATLPQHDATSPWQAASLGLPWMAQTASRFW